VALVDRGDHARSGRGRRRADLRLQGHLGRAGRSSR
jgi:hypothetical protein